MGKSFIRRFTFDRLPIHGACVELTDEWETIAAQKEYPDGIKQVLGELIAANVLLTTNIKLKGKIIAQIQDNPKVDLIVSECSHDLKIRGTARYSTSAHQDTQVSYKDCVHKGSLVISIDSNADGKVYQSVVGLTGYDLEEILTEYMIQSEQLRTVFFIAYSENKIVGFMLQQLPDNNNVYTDDIDRVFMLAETLKHSELLHYDINVILKRLFNEDDVVLYNTHEVEFRCTCSRERVTNMLRGLGLEEATSIIADEGAITVTCDFCNTVYSFNEQDVQDMFNTLHLDIECVSKEIH